MRDEVKIFVFGSCHFSEHLNNGDRIGNGGYGVVININGKKAHELTGGFSNTTNARMDLCGIMEGLQRLENPSNVTVYLMNDYIVKALTEGWLKKWKFTGYKKIKHAGLWQRLYNLIYPSPFTVTVKHAKEVKFTSEFQLAEQLGKAVSSKKNLPSDLKPLSPDELFASDNVEIATDISPTSDDEPILDSVCVDASSIQNPGPTEYRGVDTKTREIIFQRKYKQATNNIGEFLAIVHALAHFKKQGMELKIVYSDSENAISWVKQKKCKTKLIRTEENTEVFEHIQRAVTWLENNEFTTKILKWNTTAWGQIPADYGRK
jgi:ribonuclease HI